MLRGRTYVPGGNLVSSSSSSPWSSLPISPVRLAVSASFFQIFNPLVRSVQKSAIIRLLLMLPSASSVSHIPVTPKCMPPSAENGSPAGVMILKRGANEMRAEGKKAGGREWSSSSRLATWGGGLVEGEVKRSLREKSSEDQLSTGGKVRWGGRRRVAGDLGVAGLEREKPSEEEEGVRVHDEAAEKGEKGTIREEDAQLPSPEDDESEDEQADMGELKASGAPQLLLVLAFPPALHGATGGGRENPRCATSARWKGLVASPSAGMVASWGAASAVGEEGEVVQSKYAAGRA